MELANGDIAKRFWPGTCPGAMLKPAKSLTEERCSAVSLDGGLIGEEFFEHKRVSLFVWETGSCHDGGTEKKLCCGGSDPSRTRSSGFHNPQQVPLYVQSVRRSYDCGLIQGSHGAAGIPARFQSLVGRTGIDRSTQPELGGAPCRQRSGHRIRAAFKKRCSEDSSDAAVNTDSSEPPQHKTNATWFFLQTTSRIAESKTTTLRSGPSSHRTSQNTS